MVPRRSVCHQFLQKWTELAQTFEGFEKATSRLCSKTYFRLVSRASGPELPLPHCQGAAVCAFPKACWGLP